MKIRLTFESTTTGGQLKTKEALDYEIQTDYEVTVIATDTGDLMVLTLSPIQSRSLSTSGMSQLQWRHSSSEQCTSVYRWSEHHPLSG